MKFQVEVTDTFAGEANYCWVRRYSCSVVDFGVATESYRKHCAAIKRAAKKAAGFSGVRGKWEDIGDTLAFRPRGQCVVMFVSPSDDA